MAVQPAYTRSNVLTGQARAFTQVYNPSVPPVLPANTVDLGGTWPGPWTAVGATKQGLAFNFKRDVNEIQIEEQRTPVAQLTTKSTFTFELELSEDTFQAMQLAYGGGTITTVAAASGQPGYQTFVPNAELTQYAFAFEAENEFGMARRVLVPVVVAVSDAKTEYRRADAQRTYNVSLASLVEIDQCTFRNITAVALP
jgi:hypothetical protein